MVQKRNKIIIFAVIAVIIVAVPISFYGLSQKSVPVIATDGEAYANYSISYPINSTDLMCIGS